MSDFTCTSAAAALRSGELSPLDLVERCLARIDRHEPQIHAWVMVDGEGARKDARRLADELARGFDRGPLHGIPIGIKDIIDVEGWPTLAGSPLRAGHRARRDAELVARLRRAGAIILGKTVTCEFACFDPAPTRNPWNLERTPGGSSAGSAAAVALGMCLAAVGTQTGGSITRPASYCGVAGFKPTHGEIPLDGVLPVSPTLDHAGAIARTVDDLVAMIAAMAGTSPRQPLEIGEAPLLGIPSGFFLRHAANDLEAYAPVFEALSKSEPSPRYGFTNPSLRGLFVTMESTYDEVIREHRTIMAYEAAQSHRETFPEHRAAYGPAVTGLLDEGLAIPRDRYIAAMQSREHFRAALHGLLMAFDAFYTPATPSAATGLETTGDARFNSPFSFAGVPTISIPCGVTDEGLPVALQFVGHPERVDRLIAAARWCEQQIAFDARPTLLEGV
jgi:aspartyl-tRNA(Asn)/glutamyl-tRNA(Gln) amidotransferase subunit A